MKRERLTDRYLNECILYGGAIVKRHEALEAVKANGYKTAGKRGAVEWLVYAPKACKPPEGERETAINEALKKAVLEGIT